MKTIWQIWLTNKKVLDEDFRDYKTKKVIRDIGPSPRISKIHLDKAFHNLDFANFTLKNQDFNRISN